MFMLIYILGYLYFGTIQTSHGPIITKILQSEVKLIRFKTLGMRSAVMCVKIVKLYLKAYPNLN